VSSKNARSSRLFTALFSSGVAGAALFAGSAGAVSIQGGDWELDVGGIVNAYYTAASCSGTQLASGVAMANKGLGCAGENHKTTIGNGLLPSGLITKFKTTQDGIDIGGTVGIMVHAATSSGVAPNSGVDVRQAFFTLGTADAGTLKIGRDYGIFGSNAILTDMTLLGVGAPAAASQRDRVALGHIGSGYTYLDNYGQMTYTSPTFGGGFTFTGGVFSPVDAGLYVSKAYPQLQAQLSYSVEGLKVWAGGKTQKFYGRRRHLHRIRRRTRRVVECRSVRSARQRAVGQGHRHPVRRRPGRCERPQLSRPGQLQADREAEVRPQLRHQQEPRRQPLQRYLQPVVQAEHQRHRWPSW
jgi:hypothetical protein